MKQADAYSSLHPKERSLGWSSTFVSPCHFDFHCHCSPDCPFASQSGKPDLIAHSLRYEAHWRKRPRNSILCKHLELYRAIKQTNFQ